MVKEAEQHAELDKQRKDTITEKNKLSSMIYRLEKLLSENKTKLSEEHIKDAESALSSAKECLKKREFSGPRFSGKT